MPLFQLLKCGELYSFNGSVGGGSAVTTNNFRKDLTSGSIEVKNNKGRRVEQGTNGTIDVNGIVLDEKQQAAQAPIKPFTSTKGQFYIDYRSNTLLGNVTKGKPSSRYYKFGEYYKFR